MHFRRREDRLAIALAVLVGLVMLGALVHRADQVSLERAAATATR